MKEGKTKHIPLRNVFTISKAHRIDVTMANKTHCCQLLYVLIRSPQRSQAYLLGELSKGGVTEEGNMSKQLVTTIWFRSVHWLGAVADVLGGVKHSKRKSSKEIT